MSNRAMVLYCTPCTYAEFSSSDLYDQPGFRIEQQNGLVGWASADYLGRIRCVTCQK